MELIRKAEARDASRLAEILIFTKRVCYRDIFHNDRVSFGEMQVWPLAQQYMDHPEMLEGIWVYDDAFVKGLLHVRGSEVLELYVDSFFQNKGIGAALIEFAIERFGVRRLFVLEKNAGAIRFYQKHGFALTGERQPEEGTAEFIVAMERQRQRAR